MNSKTNTPFAVRLLALAAMAAGLVLPVRHVAAQPAAAARAAAAGLEALDDEKLMTELAQRGMDKLLEHFFEIQNISAEKREEIKGIIAIRLISQDSFQKLPAAERKRRIDEVVHGVEGTLNATNNANILLRQAAALIVNGSSRSVNTIEYWGENPKTQADLRPVAETVVKILDKAITLTQKECDAIVSKVTNDRDPLLRKWEELDRLNRLGKYNKAFALYDLAIAIDKSDPKRNDVCDEGVKILSDFDNADSGVQVDVKNRLGKLLLARSKYKEAAAAFNWVVAAPVPGPGEGVRDTPQAAQERKAEHARDQYEARSFLVMTAIAAKDAKAAATQLQSLVTWQKSNLSNDPAVKKGAEAAAAMMDFRIKSLQASLASDPKAKTAADDEAIAILMKLLHERPDLRTIIFEQVINRLPANPDMKSLDPLLLQALVTRGIDEATKPDTEKADIVTLQRGIEASQALAVRKDDAAVSHEDKDLAAVRVAVMLHRLAHESPADKQAEVHRAAAQAFLDYLANFKGNKERREFALDSALAIVGDLRRDPATKDDDATKPLYDRTLEIAYESGRTAFAYEYGLRLVGRGDFKKAAAVFRTVPDNPQKPQILIMARYNEMLCMQRLISEKQMSDAEKAPFVANIQKLALEINSRIDQALPAADAAMKPKYQRTRVQTVLIAADLARAQKNPQKIIQLLEGFEQSCSALPDSSDLLGSALFLRINAQMQLGKMDDALKTLSDYMNNTKDAAAALRVVSELLAKVDEAYQAALTKGAEDEIVQLAEQRAKLAHLAVEQSAKNANDPNGPAYRAFEASAIREAARRATSGPLKTEYLKKALAAYEAIMKDVKGRPVDEERINFTIGMIAFDLGDYPTAQRILTDAAIKGILGKPVIETTDATGAISTRPNDVYWEAMYKLMMSDLKIAEQDPVKMGYLKAEVITNLKRLYILWRDQTGGVRWKAQFTQMRKDLKEMENWHEDEADAVTAASQPATNAASQPATAPATQP